MSDVEALMWTLDADPHLASSFANLTVLDRPVDVARLRRRLARAAAVVPRLRQRVVPAPGRLAPPAWVDDPDVDVADHVVTVTLPPPGSERQLLDLAARLAAEPLDRARPLWRFTAIDGLADGRGALVQQLHHTITDGEGGVRLSMEFVDLERDAADPPPVTPPAPERAPEAGPAALAATLGHAVRRSAGIGRRAAIDAAGLAAHPERLPWLAGEAVATVRSLVRQTFTADGARSPLWRERSLARYLEPLRYPLADVKAAADALGGTVNDVFVAAVAGGAGAYHRERGADVGELRMAMPVSTRAEGAAATANAFAPTRTLVPVGPDPRARFDEIRARLSVTKTERALRAVGAVAGVLGLLPPPLLVGVARSQVRSVDFTTSNVRGAPFDLYVAGARVEANYPLGPLAGTAFNATTLSVAGSLDIGIHVDPAAVDDPAALRDAIEASFAELLGTGPSRARATRRATRRVS